MIKQPKQEYKQEYNRGANNQPEGPSTSDYDVMGLRTNLGNPKNPINSSNYHNQASKPSRKRLLKLLPLIFIVSLVGVIFAHGKITEAPISPISSKDQLPSGSASTQSNTITPQPAAFDKKLFSNDNPTSLWVVVNKHRPLNPKTYAPDLAVPVVPLRLGKEAGEMHVAAIMVPALESLFKAANDAKVPLMLGSGYRSYQEQVAVYGNEVKANGQAGADRESARPGYSEHQTGLAADLEPVSRLCEIADCFGNLPEGKWLAANAATYGFIIRYTKDNEPTTGYIYEPWHVRYVGIALAKELKTQELSTKNINTLEIFFGLGAAPDYQ